MINRDQAEELAQKTVVDYVNACDCDDVQDIGNVLMMLAGMCGLSMCATVGHPEAVSRMQSATDHIAEAQAGKNWQVATVQ